MSSPLHEAGTALIEVLYWVGIGLMLAGAFLLIAGLVGKALAPCKHERKRAILWRYTGVTPQLFQWEWHCLGRRCEAADLSELFEMSEGTELHVPPAFVTVEVRVMPTAT